MKYKCPCCGYYTFKEKPNGTYDICPVCFWEDDPIQLKRPELAGGANDVSLVEARQNFMEFCASERRVLPYVRKPKKSEYTGID